MPGRIDRNPQAKAGDGGQLPKLPRRHDLLGALDQGRVAAVMSYQDSNPRLLTASTSCMALSMSPETGFSRSIGTPALTALSPLGTWS
jgi:hypothetical protein